MLKKLLPLVVWVFSASYCYSDSITPYYGSTGNAAADAAMRWSMGNVLPEPPGLDINGVFYSYTPEKRAEDDMKVHIGNENAAGTGNIWKETDDWSGNPGGVEIRKVIGLPNVPRDLWGDGFIEVEGTGTVNNATVVYSYRVDPCYNPQFDPNCPNYVEPLPVIFEINLDDLYDVTKDENVNLTEEETVLIEKNEETLSEKEEEDKKKEEELKRKYRLEKAMSAVDASALFAENQRIEQMNNVMQIAVNFQYISATIPGGDYKESVILVDKKINDNKKALRNNLAQQLLHEELVGMQYSN